jgi:hypothetical protein
MLQLHAEKPHAQVMVSVFVVNHDDCHPSVALQNLQALRDPENSSQARLVAFLVVGGVQMLMKGWASECTCVFVKAEWRARLCTFGGNL